MSFSAPLTSIGSSVTGGLGFATGAGESAIGPSVPRGTSGVGAVKTGPGQYTIRQLEELWLQAGGTAATAPTAAAVAMAESGGNSSVRNPSGATGLWQILGNPFPGNAYDPLTNAKMAVAKYKSQGWGAWTTYTSGAYQKFAGDAQSAWKAISGSTGFISSGPAGAAEVAAGTVAGALGRIADLLTSGEFWLRVGETLAGIILIAMGLRSLTGSTTTPVTLVRKAARR